MSGDLAGKAALVLGGTRGIGGAISRALARMGANVAMFYQHRGAEAEALAAELSATGVRAHARQCDVGDPHALETAMADAIAELGGFDILVCNAGLTITGALADYADDACDRSFAVNVRAPFLAARLAARRMADDGRLILIGSSVATRLPGPGATLYAASKAALSGMVRGLARDLAPRRITANLVVPGPIATERNAGDSDRGHVAAGPLALKRYGTAEEVAGIVAYLVSPAGAYCTGSSYDVDGGWSA